MIKIFKNHSLILTIAFLAASLYPAINFFIPLYLRDVGITETQTGFLFGLPIFLSFLLSIPIGLSNDRYHSRIFISLGLTLSGIMHLLLGYSTSFPVILILFLLHGIGTKFFRISSESFIIKLKDNILNVYSAGMGIFSGTAKIILGLLFIFISLTFAFKLIAIIYFLLAILALYLPPTETFKLEIADYKNIFNKKTVLFILILLLFSTHFGPEMVNYSLFLEEVFYLNKTQMAIYMGIPIIFLGLSSYFFGNKLRQGYLSYKVLIWGLFMNGIGHIIQVYPDIYISFFGRFIHEIGDGAVFIFMYNGLSLLFDKDKVGGSISLVQVTQTTGLFLSAIAAGYLAAIYNHSLPFFLSGVASLIAAIIAFKFKETLTH